MAKSNKNASEMNDVKKLAEEIKGIRVAMMTTMDPDGVLRSRPMATQETEFDGRLWFFTRQHSGKVSSIQNDQHVNLAYSDVDDKVWVSVAGRARMVNDQAKMKELWTPAMKAWFPDGLEDPEIGLICVDVDSAQIWDSPSSTFVTLVGFAKAALTGKPYDANKGPETVEINQTRH